METIVIRLGEDFPKKVSWAKIGKEGGITVGVGGLTEAAKACQDRRIIVLTPPMDVLLSRVVVPGANRKQIEQAVCYALEDDLATDVETLHFALGNKNQDNTHNVAVVADEKMTFWLSELREAAIEPHVMVPETLGVPYEAGSLSVLLDKDFALVRTGLQSGYAIDYDNLSAALAGDRDNLEGGSSQVIFYNCTQQGLDFVLPPGLTIKNDDLRAKAAESDPLKLFAKGVAAENQLNLLQGQFKRHAEWDRAWQQWKLPAILLAVMLVMNTTIFGTEYFSMRSESKKLTEEIEKVFKETFPGTKKIVNPRAQMEHKLDELRGKGVAEGGSFGSLLEKSGKEIVASKGYQLQGLKFKDGILIYELQVKDLEALDDLKVRLGSADLDVDIKSATSKGGSVEARLQIREKS